MKNLYDAIVGLLPPRRKTGLMYRLIRSAPGEQRAACDLFVPPFRDYVNWNSGLGDAMFLLFGLCRAMKPETVVEIGSARGYSTCGLALACQQNGRGKVYAIDPHEPNAWTDSERENAQSNYEFLLSQLEEYKLTPTWCEVIRARSQDAARTWNKDIDLLFVDGDHSYEGIKGDFEAFLPWLGDGSIVAFHDTMWKNSGTARYMEELREQGYPSVSVSFGPGLTLLTPVVGGVPFSRAAQTPVVDHR